MNICVASDIHGSEFYCGQLVEAFKNENCDRLLLLGDILYHGPRNDLTYKYNPKAVIEMLNGISDKIIAVRGNCDAEVDNMVLNFDISAPNLLLSIDGIDFYATHGHLPVPPLKDGTILLCGHTHVPAFEKNENIYYLNPGSVSIPKMGSERGYIVIKDGIITRKTLSGAVTFQKNMK